MARVILDRVTVAFPVVDVNAKSLRANLIYLGSGGILARDVRGRFTISALSGVGLRAETGDRVALVGRNGSGKSTMLKVIAGIYPPTEGSVTVEGRVSSLLGTGIGLDEELTGHEAIEYGCLLRGISRDHAGGIGREIAEFTELGHYLSVPLRTYSAGMKMRLGFALATCDAPDVLLIDEGISAGDIYFMEKARKRAQRFLEQSNIVFLASHSEEMLQSICNKALLLDRGEIVVAGPVRDVLEVYHALGEPGPSTIRISATERLQASGGTAWAPSAGRPFASSSASSHGPANAFGGTSRTFWLSDATHPVRDAAFIGYDFGPGCEIEVRQVRLRQWSRDLAGSGCVTAVAVQLSDDGFRDDIRTADTIELVPDISRQSHCVDPAGKARFWRLLARSDVVGGGAWGLMELDFDIVPPESWEGGRAIGSEPAAANVSPSAAFDDNPFTHWTSKEGADRIKGTCWIGYDFGSDRKVEVRSFTIRQWDGGGRPNTIPVVKLQYSSDGFVRDVHTVDTVRIAQDTERNRHDVAPSARARFWRLLADSTTEGGHWGVVELRFSEHPAWTAPSGKGQPAADDAGRPGATGPDAHRQA
jgi:ABC-2 type transport system ATP-binding protein/lipopolysaccharide transport system ATP-binding protein